MKKIVVTVIGTDQVGIVSGVAKKLAEKNINILDISQTIMDDIFDMVLICDMEKANGTIKNESVIYGIIDKWYKIERSYL